MNNEKIELQHEIDMLKLENTMLRDENNFYREVILRGVKNDIN